MHHNILLPFRQWTIAVLVPFYAWRVIAALYGYCGVWLGIVQRWQTRLRAREPVQTTATVLKSGLLLFLAKHFDGHRLKDLRVHQGLTKSHGFLARDCIVTKEAIQGNVRQHGVHGLGAEKAVLVGLEIVAPALDLHVGVEVGDDAAPDLGGPEWLPSHALLWGTEDRYVKILAKCIPAFLISLCPMGSMYRYLQILSFHFIHQNHWECFLSWCFFSKQEIKSDKIGDCISLECKLFFFFLSSSLPHDKKHPKYCSND